MKIHFTKKEFRTLIKLIQISDWIMHSHKIGVSKADESVEMGIIQKIYSYSKEMGCDDLVEYSKELKMFLETDDAESYSEARVAIEEYDEETFWEELIDRISRRDTLNKYTEEVFSNLSPEDRMNALFDSETPWVEEFEKYGLERVGIVKK